MSAQTSDGPSGRELESGALNLLEVVVMALGQVAPAFGGMFTSGAIARHVKFVRDRTAGEHRPVLSWVIVPLVGVCVIGLIHYSPFQPGQGSPHKYMPIMFAVQIAVAAAYVAWLRVRRPELLTTAGSVVAGEAETVHA